jgi:dihydrodipicolinate synthase/N-acetylneuraminate lyase
MARYSFLSACKTLLTELGIENGSVRAPLRNLTSEQRDELLADLHEAGVFELQKELDCQSVEPSPADAS